MQLRITRTELISAMLEVNMQLNWNAKDKRQFQHILKSALKEGRDEKVAEKLAARTVNKTRRLEGRTNNKTTSGTGNPNKPLNERTRRELYNRARQLDISGRSKLDKRELVDAIRAHS